MRGSDTRTGSLFSYVDIETRIARDHPLWLIRELVNAALAGLDRDFARLYAREGRPSIAPDTNEIHASTTDPDARLYRKACSAP